MLSRSLLSSLCPKPAVCAMRVQEYDGGTLMECIISGSALPADFPRVIRQQREAVEVRSLSQQQPRPGVHVSSHTRGFLSMAFFPPQAKIRVMTNSNVLHPGISSFKEAHVRPGRIRTPMAPDAIPGVREAGWCVPPPPTHTHECGEVPIFPPSRTSLTRTRTQQERCTHAIPLGAPRLR